MNYQDQLTKILFKLAADAIATAPAYLTAGIVDRAQVAINALNAEVLTSGEIDHFSGTDYTGLSDHQKQTRTRLSQLADLRHRFGIDGGKV